MEIARTSLETKRKALEQFTENNLYPYTKFYLVRQFANGSAAIGTIISPRLA